MESSQGCVSGLPTLEISWRSQSYTEYNSLYTILLSQVVRSTPWRNTVVQYRCRSPYERFDTLSPKRWSNQGRPSDPLGGHRNIQNVSHNVVAVPYAANQTIEGGSLRGPQRQAVFFVPLRATESSRASPVALHCTGQRKPLLNNVVLELVIKEYVDSGREKEESGWPAGRYISLQTPRRQTRLILSLLCFFLFPSSNQCVNAIERSPVLLLTFIPSCSFCPFLLFFFCIWFLSFPPLGSVVSFVDRLSSFCFTLLSIILFF